MRQYLAGRAHARDRALREGERDDQEAVEAALDRDGADGAMEVLGPVHVEQHELVAGRGDVLGGAA